MSYTWNDCQKAIARIYNNDKQVQGTGFLVSSNHLLTCAHVVIDALGLKLNGERETILERPRRKFLIDFPRTDERNPLSREGEVIIWNPCPGFFDNRSLDKACFGEDVALVKLDKEIAEEDIRPVNLSGMEDFSDKPEFDTYGFPPRNDKGEFTTGNILGQNQIWLQLQRQDNTLQIRRGYSGSPICCGEKDRKVIVGMTVASTYYSKGESPEKNKAYAIPGKALRQVWLQGQLMEYLISCDWKLIKQAYDNNRPKDWSSKQPENTIEAVTDLSQYYEEHKDKDNSLMNFVIYLIGQVELSESLKLNLRQWAKKVFGVTEPQLAQKCDQLKEQQIDQTDPQRTNIESRLWIILNKSGSEPHYKLESAYYIKDINTYERENKDSYKQIKHESDETLTLHYSQLQDRNFLFSDLSDLLRKIYGYKSLRIEFFIPFNSLDLIVDSWLIQEDEWGEPVSVGSAYPVVIRVLERNNQTYSKNLEWKNNWNWEPQHIDKLTKERLICCEQPRDKISEKLEQEAQSLGLRCLGPIEKHKHGDLKASIMREAVPITLWLRQELEICCSKDKHQELLDTKLVDLPQKIKYIRKIDPQNEQHIARHLSLIWDDPTKLLPPGPPPVPPETISKL